MLMLRILFALFIFGGAQANGAGRGGAYLGLVEFDEMSHDTISLGAFYEVASRGQVSLGVQGEFWDVDLSSNQSVRDLSVAGYGKLYIPTGSLLTPFIQGGLGLHFLKTRYGSFSDSDTEIGLDLSFGSLVRLSTVSLGISYQIRNVGKWDYSQIQIAVTKAL